MIQQLNIWKPGAAPFEYFPTISFDPISTLQATVFSSGRRLHPLSPRMLFPRDESNPAACATRLEVVSVFVIDAEPMKIAHIGTGVSGIDPG